jgi:hypothetical protein
MIVKVKMRTPNELFYDDVNIDPEGWKTGEVFEDEVFGWYLGMYVAIDKESYKKIENEESRNIQ